MGSFYDGYREYRKSKRRYNASAASIPLLIILGVFLKSIIKLKYVMLALIVIAAIFGVIYLIKKEDDEETTTIDLDTMTSEMFALYCQRLLILNGFDKVRAANINGNGIDLLAEKDGEVFGIKCVIEEEGNEVDAHIIRSAKKGSKYFYCNNTVIITNRYFTTNSHALADSEEVLLWDRKELINNLLKNDKDIKII